VHLLPAASDSIPGVSIPCENNGNSGSHLLVVIEKNVWSLNHFSTTTYTSLSYFESYFYYSAAK